LEDEISFARNTQIRSGAFEGKKLLLTQSRKGAKKTLRNAEALCAFAPLREKSSSTRYFSCKAG